MTHRTLRRDGIRQPQYVKKQEFRPYTIKTEHGRAITNQATTVKEARPVGRSNMRLPTTSNGLLALPSLQLVLSHPAETQVAGQIMSAAALLASNRRPSDSDIDAAMPGNIWRCVAYVPIRESIKHAAGAGGD